MLEINEFNAVRISLASPEQIRSWSYGEVTKPETINYRTLKPEKDGLFCERIFGPTRDWECFCGKYKRIRFKGVVCDKCGVEVARSKVRRERMGHVELAAPVSHIWFVKGTPSRVGLLLDVSPRSLERVLYFAQYIITDVDEAEKQRALDEIDKLYEVELSELDKRIKGDLETLDSQFNIGLEELTRAKEEALAEVEARSAASQENLRQRGEELDAALGSMLEQSTPNKIDWEGKLITRRGSIVRQSHIKKLELAISSSLEIASLDAESERDASIARFDAEIDLLRQRGASSGTERQDTYAENRKALETNYKERRAEIDEIKPLFLMNEIGFRALNERYQFFKAGMGAEAVRDIISKIDLDELTTELRNEIRESSSSGQRRKKATKRLRVAEAFRRSGNRPEWMVLAVLPVLPPELRPMVQLDGGRFATSDLNDLYRRVINRNNRLKRLLDLEAPEIIVRNEKRMLQEAVDSLIDNGRRGRAVSNSSSHKLKSLSDLLKGKQGRFRQNLLGKRVDYSGRSVIIVGPTLKLHQCGLPKKMALELFKPFVMRRLVDKGFAHNIKSAKRIVERVRPEVWDILEEVIDGHPVLLNRAPTLHRLGIQAFMPVLKEGSAIQIHPLVCAAFGADFDGDQMAVHVPLSEASRNEALEMMLSTHNVLLPSNGEPTVAPTLDMVLGCYYLTLSRPGAKGEGKWFSSPNEAMLAYELGVVDLHAAVNVVAVTAQGERAVSTSVGRVIFNEVLPESFRYTDYTNEVIDRRHLRTLVGNCYHQFGSVRTSEVVDEIKRVGFDFATRSGITIAISDLEIPSTRDEQLAEADRRVSEIEDAYRRGLITDEERYNQAVTIWTQTTEAVTKELSNTLDPYGSLHMMTNSGAKGNIVQVAQMAAMRGLMVAPSGRIIELPIRSSFREGLTVLEYFISTHGARKGLADTAIRTADSGYLTRRLIDVSQDVIIVERDCGTLDGIYVTDRGMFESLASRLYGRVTSEAVIDPETGEVLVERDEEIGEDMAARISDAGITRVAVRSPLTCQCRKGICQLCYGLSLARGRLVDLGEAVGIIAAQSIGEPGTQLTMRTFHTGGIAGQDITTGLPRVEELFEARVPKGQAIISEIDGVASVYYEGNTRHIKVVSSQNYSDVTEVPPGAETFVSEGDGVDINTVLARVDERELTAALAGVVRIEEGQIVVEYQEEDSREYTVPPLAQIKVEDGEAVTAGQALTDGPRNPQDVLRIQGREAAQIYLVEEVQNVYRSQGVTINDKHIEIVARQMLRRVRVETPGDTEILPGELIDAFEYEEINARVLAEGGEPATAQSVLLGVTKASLNNESFLAAASFQETTRVLTEAAVQGRVDRLVGLKENVIIGKLIPAGSGIAKRREIAARKDAFLAIATDALIGNPSDDDPPGEEILFQAEPSNNGGEGDSVSQVETVEPADAPGDDAAMPEDESHSAQIVDPASDSANTVESVDAPGDDAAMPEDESHSAKIVDPASDSADLEASEDVSSPTAVEDEATTASNVQADDAPAQPSAEPAPAAADLSTEPVDAPGDDAAMPEDESHSAQIVDPASDSANTVEPADAPGDDAMPEDESHSAQIVDPASDSANTVESVDAPGDDAAMPEDESHSAQIVDPASDSANTVESVDPASDDAAMPEDESLSAQIVDPASDSADIEASDDVSSPTAVDDEATTASNVQADDAPAQPSAEPAPAAADLSTESADEPDAGAVS